MKTALLMVRHGQAGADPAHYDQLSELGARQSRRLAEYLLSHGQQFTHCCSGSLVRQRLTLAEIRDSYAQAGQALPEPETLSALDEYRFDALVAGLALVEPGHPALLALQAEPGNRRLWIPVLRAALLAWGEGRLDPHVPEPYGQFSARVRSVAALLRERVQAATAPVLAVSSGGVIAAFIQHALGAPHAAAVDLNLSLRNSAQVAFGLDRDGQWRLQSFNAMPHLTAPEDREMWTLI